MDWQSMFNVAATLAGVLGGFVLRATWDAIERMRVDLQALQTSIAATYVRRDDHRDFAQQVLAKLDMISAKLDEKADK